MGIILMILAFIVGGYILGIAWLLVFWLASFLIFLIAKILSLFGIFLNIAGEKNIWYLFLVVCLITWLVFNSVSDLGCAIGGSIFVFLTGAFMLFKSADTWKIAESNG
jgi:hypothetical protein